MNILKENYQSSVVTHVSVSLNTTCEMLSYEAKPYLDVRKLVTYIDFM